LNGIHQVIFFWTLVARQISRCIDKDPRLKPDLLPIVNATSQSQIALSSTQEAQIREIFQLFDTDGGGTIDRNEIDFAMVALGFQSADEKPSRGQRHHDTTKILDEVAADGHMTLEEFVALMTGHKAGGSDPMHAVATAFAVLSRSSCRGAHDNLITFEKLQVVCRDFEVG
jgi:Ca2+-binding EF-hand superfamily protein